MARKKVVRKRKARKPVRKVKTKRSNIKKSVRKAVSTPKKIVASKRKFDLVLKNLVREKVFVLEIYLMIQTGLPTTLIISEKFLSIRHLQSIRLNLFRISREKMINSAFVGGVMPRLS